MALSPELNAWLRALPPDEIKRLVAFGGRSDLGHRAALAFLGDLGDAGLRALDARFRAAVVEPAPEVAPAPADVPPPPADVPPPPVPAPPSEPPEVTPPPAGAPEGGVGLSPRSPVAGDPRVSPTVPPRPKAETPKVESERAPDAPRLWVVRLRNRRSLEVGRNAEYVHLNHKRFSAPLAASFVEYIVSEYEPQGYEFEIVPEGSAE